MQFKGLSRESVAKELESRLEKDFTYDSGKILGSMCTLPHAFARKLCARYLEKNLGDSGLFPAVVDLEKETIEAIGSLLSNSKASGHIVTGGTEANILALWAAARRAGKNHGEVIVPSSAHCSFDKAASLMNIKVVKVGLNRDYQVDIGAVERAINSSTVAIVGMAGTTGLGVVDPISELSEIALENDLYLHVDAAFGGFVLPFLKDMGHTTLDFDFALEGVCSITVDPHKMGLVPIPAGGILFRNEELRKKVAWNISYLSGGESEQATLVGTRSGASIITTWALMKHLGREGYKKIVSRCMRLTWKLADEIPKIDDMNVMTEPIMNIVGLTSQKLGVNQIAEELRLKKWAVALFPHHIRIVVMPHVRRKHVERFLEDLNDVADILKRTENRKN